LVYFTMIRGRSLLIKSRSKVKVVDRWCHKHNTSSLLMGIAKQPLSKNLQRTKCCNQNMLHQWMHVLLKVPEMLYFSYMKGEQIINASVQSWTHGKNYIKWTLYRDCINYLHLACLVIIKQTGCISGISIELNVMIILLILNKMKNG
jgi:hypothetical protein